MKDNEIANLVTTLANIAKAYGSHDSIMQRLSNELVPKLKHEHDRITELEVYQTERTDLISHMHTHAARIAELEEQLADAKQAARWESDLASQALADMKAVKN